jgi:hypothetical protein
MQESMGGLKGGEHTEARTARNERAYDIHHRDAWYALCVLQSEVYKRCMRGELVQYESIIIGEEYDMRGVQD